MSPIPTKKRCDKCNCVFKKFAIINECKCKKFFCFNCVRYDIHGCSYDWKKEKKEHLTESNPLVNFQKIENI